MKLTYLKDDPLEPWLPEELLPWEWVRKVLGVLKPPSLNPKGETYLDLHDEKVLELIRLAPVREKDDPQNLLEDLLPEGWERLGEKASPEKILEAMKANASSWQNPRRYLLRYLRSDLPLEDLKDNLGSLADKNRLLVSRSKFREELNDLTLREFLELPT